ncbi:MAG: zinc ribbon domain-containing protein [Desulfococcaceae bacterium]
MPIYEFECRKCHSRFEKLIFSTDTALPECPECSSRDVEKCISAGFVRAHGIPTGSGGFKQPSGTCAARRG